MPETMPQHPEAVLARLGLSLPAPPQPRANYVKAVRSGQLVFLAGQGPRIDADRTYEGKLGGDVAVTEGQEAARQIVLNSMATLKALIGDLDDVTQVVKLLCFVNSDPSFTETHRVADGASDLLVAMFGQERGRHARSAVGTATLPFGISVEIEMVIEVG